MDLYLIRHGDPDYATDSLTEKGKVQAQKLADFITRFPCDGVYASPMGRAQQTASYSAKALGKEVETLEWLRELRWGDMSGDAYSTSSPWTIADGIVASTKSYPQDESWKTMAEYSNDRVVEDLENRWKELDKFLEVQGYKREGLLYNAVSPNDKSIMCFCHGGIISGIASHLFNVPFCQLILHMPVHLTSIMKIRLNPGLGTAKLDFILPPEIY